LNQALAQRLLMTRVVRTLSAAFAAALLSVSLPCAASRAPTPVAESPQATQPAPAKTGPVAQPGTFHHLLTMLASPPKKRKNLLNRWMDKLNSAVIRNHKKLGINAITEERPFFQTEGDAAGLVYGFTMSHVTSRNAKAGRELIHVVDPSGGSNLEWVITQKNLFAGQRFEVQGPAINTSFQPGELPIGARFFGIGIVANINQNENVSLGYTFELKATEKTAAYYVPMLLPGLAAGVAKLAEGGLAHGVAQVFSYAVPGIAAYLALDSTRAAARTLLDPRADDFRKAVVVAHAAFDWLRVAFPLAGTLGNVAVAATDIAVNLVRAQKLARAEAAKRAAAAEAVAAERGAPAPPKVSSSKHPRRQPHERRAHSPMMSALSS
jgi:hypothetical protein